MSDSDIRIPYVIDNQTHRMADVLGALLREHSGSSLDNATAYFLCAGFGLLREGLLGDLIACSRFHHGTLAEQLPGRSHIF